MFVFLCRRINRIDTSTYPNVPHTRMSLFHSHLHFCPIQLWNARIRHQILLFLYISRCKMHHKCCVSSNESIKWYPDDCERVRNMKRVTTIHWPMMMSIEYWLKHLFSSFFFNIFFRNSAKFDSFSMQRWTKQKYSITCLLYSLHLHRFPARQRFVYVNVYTT